MRLQSILKGLVLATVTVWPAPRAAADPVRLLDDAVKALRSGNLSGALQRTREAEFELQQQLLNASPPPQQQTAPPDARFNSPLVVPLDSTASVLDFVSFPEGDRIDQVQYRVTGMNPNPSLSGGRARLTIAVSCSGQGMATVSFNVGRKAFSCGQTVVDHEVTATSNTGTITIAIRSAQTPAYVQWVLTAQANRIN